MQPIVSFRYRNHRGEEATRCVLVECVEYKQNPGFGYPPGFFLTGICQDKGERRSFSFANMVVPPEAGSFTLLRFQR